MSGEKKFSRITVTSDGEDDVVIQAGVPAASASVPASAAPVPASAAPVPAASDFATGPVPSGQEPASADQAQVFAEAENPVPASASVPAPASAPAPAPVRRAKRAESEYHETTLEDLEVGKMSSMQKGIIAVAVLLIAAFVVYLLV